MDADLLRSARRRAGLTQAELARRAGTSRTTVSAYEAGRKSPSTATMERLLQAAGARLAAEPAITFVDIPVGRGRTVPVPSGLPRLPIDQAFAHVLLPLHIAWSTPDRAANLADRHERARAYEQVLVEGTAADIARMVDGALLVDLWPDLVLPRAVRDAWTPLIESSVGHAA